MTMKLLMSALVLVLSPLTMAIELGSENLTLSGFATTSVTRSNNSTPFYINRNIDDSTCYDCDTTLGLQFDYQALDNLSFSLQTVKRPEDDYSDVAVEWAYGNWQINDDVGLRLGRLRIPTYLTSEYYYVGNAYPWVRPPSEVYNKQFGVTSYNGVELNYHFLYDDAVSFTLRSFYSPHNTDDADFIVEKYDITFDDLYGGVIEVEADNLTLRYQISHATGSADIKSDAEKYSLPEFAYNNQTFGIIYTLGSVDWWLEYQINDDYYTANNSYYTALVWHTDDFSPYINYGETRDTLANKKSSRTIIVGIRIGFPNNFSLNLEGTRSENLITPEEVGEATKGQFVYSNWSGTPGGQWVKDSSQRVTLMTLALNWNF